MEEATHHIEIGDLSDEARQIAEAIGLDGLMALASAMGGGYVYVPHLKCLAMEARNRMICSAFNGRNLRELSIQYGLSRRRIRSIVAKVAAARRQSKEKEGVATQLKMF